MIRTVLCFMAALGFWLSPAVALAAAPMSEADIQAERLLWAVGSRPVWASLTNTVVDSQQYRRDDPTDVGAVIITLLLEHDDGLLLPAFRSVHLRDRQAFGASHGSHRLRHQRRHLDQQVSDGDARACARSRV